MKLFQTLLFLAIGIGVAMGAIVVSGYRVEVLSFGGGIAAAAIAGILTAQFNGWWGTVVRPYQPQSIRLETKETPAQITGAATRTRIVAPVLLGVSALAVLAIMTLNGWKFSLLLWGSVPAALFLVAFFLPVFFAK